MVWPRTFSANILKPAKQGLQCNPAFNLALHEMVFWISITRRFAMNLYTIKNQSGFSILMSLSLLFTLLRPKVGTNVNMIVVSTTIQAAVDAASPGDTVHVPPGAYHENVFVTKDNITIEGSQGAILDGTGLTGSGITVRSQTPLVRINGFRLSGLRIQNYVRNGVILSRVDNYQID